MSAVDLATPELMARGLLDNLLEGCQVIGPDFRYLYVNEAVTRHGRTTRAALLGRTMMEAYPGIESTDMFAALRRTLEERLPGRMENQFVYPDGTKAWFELRFEAVPEGVLVLSVDITERRRAEDALRRQHRALTMLSDCNQTLVRATDEAAFFQDVCRIAVSAGYRLAWIGLADQDEARTVRPVAAAGVDEGYVAALHVTWDDAPSGRGPTGRAIRSGTIAVAQNLRTDPDFAPWRDEAHARGYASSIALPFQIAGETAGALSIYAAEPDAFDADEEALLAELALDLGYGLTTLRARAAHAHAEDELREVRERYRLLLDYAPVGIAVLSDGRFAFCNTAAARIMGASTPEEITGMSIVDTVHPDVRAAAAERVRRLLAGEQGDYPVESLCLRRDGTSRPVEVTAIPLTYLGKPAVQMVITDISAKKHSADELRRLNARLGRLARVVQDLSGARDIPSITELVRQAARALTGADGATFILRDGDQCHYLDEDAIAPLWKGQRFPMSACVSGWVMTHREAAVIEDLAADGRIPLAAYEPTFVKSLAMVPIRRDAPVGAIGVYWAQRRRATDDELSILQALADSCAVAMENVRMLGALQHSEERYRSLVENLEDVVFSVDGSGRMDYVSSSIATFGFTPEEVVGRPFVDFVLPDDRAELVAALARILAGHVESRVFRVHDKAGKIRTVRTASRVVLHEGRPVGIAGVMIDLTELRRTEEQLRLSQKMEAVGQLAGGVAHDFNNLLSVILSYADFARDSLHEGDPLREDIEEIRRAGQRAAALTHQLLAFSRKQVLEPRVLELNRIAADLERMLRRLIGEDIDLVQVLAPDLGRVKADPGQLEQVIMNLVVNARDAMPSGGKVTIETANVELDEESAAPHVAMKPGPYVRLAISDTGCGMDEATRQRLFEPFFTTKGQGKGTGLGLSTVYGIVKQSGGSIWVYSEPGHGTTFKVYLPRVVDDTAPLAPSVGHDRPALGDETILVVEDEEAVRNLTARILRTAGFQVLVAAHGGEALLECERHPGEIHLLLTDVIMPQMSGRQLAERLQKIRPGLRVLYMSGYTNNAIVHHGVLDPGTRFVGKPFTAAELARKVRDALDS